MNTDKDPKIILLEHREDYRAIYGMNLMLYIGAEVLVAHTIKEVMTFLETHNVSLVFVCNDAYSQDTGAEIWKIFAKKQINTPLFIIGNSKVPQDEVTLFDSKTQLRDVLKSIARSVNVTSQSMAVKDFPEYFPIPMEFLLPGWQTMVDLYSKVGDDFEIIFHKEDLILYNTLEELENSGNYQLYVDRNLRLKFVNSLTGQISAKLNDPNLSVEERCHVTATGYRMVMEQARQVGISESTLKMANECINSMTKIIESLPNLELLFGNLVSAPGSYRFNQSLLIAYIGSHIIKKIPWGNKEQQIKFAFVSFFHNIALTEDEYVKIGSDEELEKSTIPDHHKKIISKHALYAARLIANDKIPFGADTIVKQHHGSKNGIGLSRISLNISPLAIIFMFAEEWANIALKYDDAVDRPSKSEIIEMLHKKFNMPAFNKILPILNTLDI